jgi:uncharacterized protein (TIGR02246 family)
MATQPTTDLSKRTPQQIFEHHGQALGAEDPEAVVLDYTDDAYVVTAAAVLQGKEAIRNFFVNLLQELPKAQWDLNTTFVDDVLYLEWSADSARASVSDGVDTFIFKDGHIRLQTVHYTPVEKK